MSEQTYSLLDTHFARFMADRSGLESEDKVLFQALVQNLSAALSAGHSCLPVEKEEKHLLTKCSLVSDGKRTPLILHKDKFYLHKYFTYELHLAQGIAGLAAIRYKPPGGEKVVESCFVGNCDNKGEIDWQKMAAETAVNNCLCIISGGPGTGKTSTVVRIIGLLLQILGPNQEVALAAPTGKAAMRLKVSIGNSLASLPFAEEIIKKIPTEAGTLHRLLGVQRNSTQFRHHRENPLSQDVVVVDEASMVDLAMMSKLVDALKPEARLILLGDKDQLASVESGSVLADLISSLPDNTVELKKSYRFDTGIKQLALHINKGEGEDAWSLLLNDRIDNVNLLQTSLSAHAGSHYTDYMAKVSKVKALGQQQEIFHAFSRFRVLCGVRRGMYGVEGINKRIEHYLTRMGYDCFSETWYPGRPVLITRNDYSLGLYNGDVGICLPDPDDGVMKIWFEQADGSLKHYLPFRLPQCETVYAMTIHKSQGSEFDEVLVVLPEEDSLILSRELIYTAVTRAKKDVRILAEKEIFKVSLARKVQRFSGLAEAIMDM